MKSLKKASMKDYNLNMSQKAVNKTKKTKKARRTLLISKIIGVIILVVSIGIFINVGKDLAEVISLNKQANEVEKELESLKAENAELIATKEKFEDPNYVTTYAKGEYMFSKGDEKLFRLPSKSE